MILLAHPSKPFQYTPKNAPRRQVILNLYEPEISALYQAVEESTQAEIQPPVDWSYDAVVGFVRVVVKKVLGKNGEQLEDEDDIFQAGADRYAYFKYTSVFVWDYSTDDSDNAFSCSGSLQATWIRNTVLRAVRDSAKVDTNTIPPNVVFEHPTIASLSSFASRFVGQSQSGTDVPPPVTITEEDKVQNMLNLVSKYTRAFPARHPTRSRVLPRTTVVLITGTTGGLGTRLLSDLVASPDVSRIYAVNRKQRRPLEERQREGLRKQGLDVSIAESKKVVLVEADVNTEDAGFEGDILDEVGHRPSFYV